MLQRTRNEKDVRFLTTLRAASILLTKQRQVLQEMTSSGEMSLAEADSHLAALDRDVANLQKQLSQMDRWIGPLGDAEFS